MYGSFKSLRIIQWTILALFFSACASRVSKYEKIEELKKNEEFDRQVQIVAQDPSSIDFGTTKAGSVETVTPLVEEPPKKKAKQRIVRRKPKKGEVPLPPKVVEVQRRQPEIESEEGFDGRRPLRDPFRVGEKVVHTVSWMKINAGGLSFEVKPFVQVNGRKSYQYEMQIWTNSFFTSIYSVKDKLITLVDYETLVPSVFTLHVKHTTELREARWLSDREKKMATYWEKKVTNYDGEKEKKIQWEIPEFSQNVYSGLFYMRNFQWDVDKEHAFQVADDNENLIFKAKAIRKERIETDIGPFDTIVVKPEVTLKGIAKPVGDIFMWLSDDDRKFILKIESKVKIGTFVTEVSELHRGQE